MSDLLTYISHQLHTNQFFSGAVVGGILLGVWQQAKTVLPRLFDFLYKRFTVSVTIDSNDAVFPFFVEWIANQSFDSWTKSYLLKSNLVTPMNRPYDSSESVSTQSDLNILKTPAHGRYFIRLGVKFIMANITYKPHTEGNESRNQKPYQAIHLVSFGRAGKVFEDIFDKVNKLYAIKQCNNVKIYMPEATLEYWTNYGDLTPRSKESVITHDDSMHTLIADIQKFKNRRSWYVNVGIPYKRGYLLYGPPGTGKTSSIKLIASELKLNMYVFNFSAQMTNEKFLTLMSEVRPNSIIIWEDVDCLFSETDNRDTKSLLNFSTLINALDGIGTKDGMIYVMTTNKLDKLDAALLRKGRMDFKLEFTLCDSVQLFGMFTKFFPDNEKEGHIFANALTEFTYSPAEIQEFLLNYNNAQDVIDNIDVLISSIQH